MITHWIKAKDGKEYAVKFSNYVGTQLAMMQGVAVRDTQKFLSAFLDWDVSTLYRFYFLAFKSGAKSEGKNFDMSEDDFVYWVCDQDETIMPQVNKIMTESQPDPQKKTKAK